MMKTLTVQSLFLATTFALASCGGGGGGIASSGSTPPPITPPPPPTTGYEPAIILPNVTSSTQFAALGYEGKFFGTTEGSLNGSGFSVSYDAAANHYVMQVPVSLPGIFKSTDPGDPVISGKLTDPSNPDQLQPIGLGASRSRFDYSAWAFYQEQLADQTISGWMAFGVPTPQSAVPVTGSAAYTAEAHGYGGAYIDGRATLQFNFGAGTLSGSFDAWDAEYDPGVMSYGHFDLVNTAVGSGQSSGQFSGELSGSSGNQHGSFNGMLTGPNAEELIARWNATYPNSNNIMYGVWVGKKD
jgi:hypothetical protein